jgi:hypothetical protein
MSFRRGEVGLEVNFRDQFKDNDEKYRRFMIGLNDMFQ